MSEWYAPIDFDCPEVRKWTDAFFGDPMTDSVPGDVVEDIAAAFEKKHRASCRHCQEYGVDNIEARYD